MQCPFSHAAARLALYVLLVAASLIGSGCTARIQTAAHPGLLCRDLRAAGIECSVDADGPRVHRAHLLIATRIALALSTSADAINGREPTEAAGAGPLAWRVAEADADCEVLRRTGRAWACVAGNPERVVFIGPSGPDPHLPAGLEIRHIPLPALPAPVALSPIGPFVVGAHQRAALRALSAAAGATLMLAGARIWLNAGRSIA